MNIAYVGSGETLTALTTRVYGLPAGTSDATLKEAGAVLTKANPHLTADGSLPKGTPIVVPATPTLTPSADAKPATGLLGSALDTLDTALADYRRKLVSIDDDESSHAKETVRFAGTAEGKSALADKEVSARIKPIVDAAQTRLDQAAQIRKNRQAVADTIKADVAKLRARAGG